MKIKPLQCDECKEKGKGSYTTFWLDDALVTLCKECRYGTGVPRNTKHPEEIFNSLHVPFWKLMGQKPKPKDIAYEKMLKSKGMTYGDAVRERDYLRAKNESAFPKLQQYLNRGGK